MKPRRSLTSKANRRPGLDRFAERWRRLWQRRLRRRPLLGFFLALFGLIDLVIFVASTGSRPAGPLSVFGVAVATSQATMLSLWIASSSRNAIGRYAAALALAGAVSSFSFIWLAAGDYPPRFVTWNATALASSSLFLAVQVAGFAAVRILWALQRRHQIGRRRWSFSLQNVLVLMTAAAALAGVTRQSDLRFEGVVAGSIAAVALALYAGPVVWASSRGHAERLLLVVGGLPLVVLLGLAAAEVPADAFPEVYGACFVHTLALAIGLKATQAHAAPLKAPITE